MSGRRMSQEEKARIQQAVKEGIAPGRLKVLALEMGRPPNTISAYLGRIGASPLRVRWSQEELAILEEQAQAGGRLRAIQQALAQAGFQRSIPSIQWGRRKLGGPRNLMDADGCYNALTLGQALGVRRETVVAWIRRGWLRARQSDSAWVIKPHAVRRFLIEHVQEVNFSKADKFFLVDILAGQVGKRS